MGRTKDGMNSTTKMYMKLLTNEQDYPIDGKPMRLGEVASRISKRLGCEVSTKIIYHVLSARLLNGPSGWQSSGTGSGMKWFRVKVIERKVEVQPKPVVRDEAPVGPVTAAFENFNRRLGNIEELLRALCGSLGLPEASKK